MLHNMFSQDHQECEEEKKYNFEGLKLNFPRGLVKFWIAKRDTVSIVFNIRPLTCSIDDFIPVV